MTSNSSVSNRRRVRFETLEGRRLLHGSSAAHTDDFGLIGSVGNDASDHTAGQVQFTQASSGTPARPLFRNSIVSTNLDFITADDPSTFESMAYLGRARREMPDRRPGTGLFANNTFIFEATFSDGNQVQIWLHPNFGSQQNAATYANLLRGPLGKLPESMRENLNHVVVHVGNETAFAESQANFFVLYSQNMLTRISNNDLEETVFHESVHAALDANNLNTSAWLSAQQGDNAFITEYAREIPGKEDMAETAIFAYTMLQHPGRLPAYVEQWMEQNNPNKLAFFADLYADDLTTVAEPPSDFGDAPDSYDTTLASDGARHAAVGPILGTLRDVDEDARAPLNGTSDNDDGVMFGAIGVNASMAAVNIDVSNAIDEEAKVDAWIDFNRDGDFEDPGENVLQNVTVNNGMQTLNFFLPNSLTVGENYARVRLSSEGGLGPNGLAADGEVEDYVIQILAPPVVESVVINDGDNRRSVINEVRITFDQVVDIDLTTGDAFEFFNQTSGQIVQDIPVIDNTSGKTVVEVTFAPGPSVNQGGGLLDGDYRLTIDPELIKLSSLDMDGDTDGQEGGVFVFGAGQVDNFYRAYGDFDLSGSVNLADFAAFRQAFGNSLGDANYLDQIDADSDGMIGLTDFANFRENFGN
ncbi:GEVED domain-containing protein [Rubripirellula obstinata]|uniref:GEVED domain-containing protein n=1 Tax=Rubripirellula obstinata TaxID=406547 RepID=UPI0012FBFC49|nr:GEVED domain-containing protein [Rubripirellula obstinata]